MAFKGGRNGFTKKEKSGRRGGGALSARGTLVCIIKTAFGHNFFYYTAPALGYLFS
jgi:hypothetical protein